MAKILVIDDEQAICWAVRKVLEREGHEVAVAGTAEDGLEAAEESRPDVVLLDVRLPGMDGLEALGAFRERSLAGEVIVITAHGTMETAVDAIHRGAFDYLVKPLDTEKLKVAVVRAAQSSALHREVEGLKARLEGRAPHALVGSSAPMQEVFKRIGMVSMSDASVLIQGETGTGKEVAARAIHDASARKGGPFVPVHLAAIPETLLESELFGFEKGAFTGAFQSRPGRLLRANGGTLFLDEVKEVPRALQVKLLRVLEERRVEGLGAEGQKELDVRVVAATQGDLEAEVKAGRFREDLYFRLNVFGISMPPLRERKDDIPLLASHFLEAFRGTEAGITPEALAMLTAHDWPGNVRELRNAVEHAAVLARGRPLTPDHFPENVRGGEDASERALPLVREAVRRAVEEGKGSVYDEVLAVFEKPLIAEVLRRTSGNQVKASEILGIHRTTLRKKIEKYGLG